MEPLLNDRALLDSFRRGERAALERVYYEYVDRVFSLVRYGFPLQAGTRVPGIAAPDEQGDVVHDVFVKAFAEKARLAYDGLRPYEPYLLRIAKNALVDAWRRHGKELPSANVEEAANAAVEPAMYADGHAGGDANGRAVDVLHSRALRDATQACVAQMDDELRRFIHYRFEEDLPQRDVAAQMGTTRRRARTLEARALDLLRKYLSKQGFL